MTTEGSFLVPEWPAPARVKAFATTRAGGVSQSPYHFFNLASHVGDNAAHVAENRQRLAAQLDLPQEPHWLTQVHGVRCLALPSNETCADASSTTLQNEVCVVMTADCLPVLFCDEAGTWVAAAHAGWRGLCEGVLEQTISTFSGNASSILAWLGPAIGPQQFEVGPEVREAFIAHDPDAARCFKAGQNDRYFADIFALAKQRLSAAGVSKVWGGGVCTVSDASRFFSYRRDSVTGRQASLIWLEG